MIWELFMVAVSGSKAGNFVHIKRSLPDKPRLSSWTNLFLNMDLGKL
jgi:hypothetical protein